MDGIDLLERADTRSQLRAEPLGLADELAARFALRAVELARQRGLVGNRGQPG
jgi:hypothetical protein